MTKARTKDVKCTVYFTTEMEGQIKQVLLTRDRDCSHNDLIREAVTLFLETQSDLITSQKYFKRGLKERLDALEERVIQHEGGLHFYLMIILHMMALSFATILSHVTKEKITPQTLLQRAIIEARKEELALDAQVQAVREMEAPRS